MLALVPLFVVVGCLLATVFKRIAIMKKIAFSFCSRLLLWLLLLKMPRHAHFTDAAAAITGIGTQATSAFNTFSLLSCRSCSGARPRWWLDAR